MAFAAVGDAPHTKYPGKEIAVIRQCVVACLIGLAGVAVSRTAAADQLLAGVASADITPEAGLNLWGYSNRTHGATSTLDPLMAKALVLQVGKTSVAIVSLDLGRTPEDHLLAELRDKTLARCGVGNLLIAASHTHHAADAGIDRRPQRLRPQGHRRDREDHRRSGRASRAGEDRRRPRHG